MTIIKTQSYRRLLFGILFFALFLCFTLVSCRRSRNAVPVVVPQAQPAAASPVAVLQSGEYPLWFQAGAGQPLRLESIEDAVFSTALAPWPLAAHIRFTLSREDEVLMAVNRGGFFRFAPWEGIGTGAGGEIGTGLYYHSGGEFWRAYTLASFVFLGDIPAALLYRDDRFLDTDLPLPDPRAWSFNAESQAAFPLDIPAFSRFGANDGWDIDALRYAADGFWYYRAMRRESAKNEMLFFRTQDLTAEGEAVTLGDFQNSAQPEPLAAAAQPLRTVLDAMEVSPNGTVCVLAPGLPGQRFFARNAGGQVDVLACLWGGNETPGVAAVDIAGNGLYARASTIERPADPLFLPLVLPRLPENFVYTGIAVTGETLIATWEEQENFYIGAAGFMVLKLP